MFDFTDLFDFNAVGRKGRYFYKEDEKGDTGTLELEVPGLKKEDLKISVQDRGRGVSHLNILSAGNNKFFKNVTYQLPRPPIRIVSSLADGILTLTITYKIAEEPIIEWA